MTAQPARTSPADPATAPATTLPPDLPEPLAPQFFRDRCHVAATLPDADADADDLAVALAVVLAGATGAHEAVVGRSAPAGPGATPIAPAARYEVRPDTALGDVAPDPAPGPLPAVAVVAVALVDSAAVAEQRPPAGADVVVYRAPGLLVADYDTDRYSAPGMRLFLDEVGVVLRELTTRPKRCVADLGIARRTPAAQDGPRLTGTAPAEQPTGPVEQAVAAIWADLLADTEPSAIGRDVSFFALGGNSVTAVRAANRLRDRFDVELPGDLVSAAQTVQATAQAVEEVLAGQGRAAVAGPRRRPAGTAAPASFEQERIWLDEQLAPGGGAYEMAWVVEVRGELRTEVLRHALAEVVRRHEVLRTAYPEHEGVPRPLPHEDAELSWAVHDLSAVDEEHRGWLADRLVAGLREVSFDVARGPLLRAQLVDLAADRHLLLVAAHHLVFDGWSFEVLLRETAAGYDAWHTGGPVPPAPPVQYADVAAWQRASLTPAAVDEAVAHWRRELADAPPVSAPEPDRPRPAVPTRRGATVAFALPDRLVAAVRALAEARTMAPYAVYVTAFVAALARSTGRSDVVVGTNVTTRDHRDTEELIGPLFNMLPVRADVGDDPVLEHLLGRTNRGLLAGFARKAVPFDVLVDRLAVDREPGRSPVYQVLFELATVADVPPPAGLSWSHRLVAAERAKLDLALTLTEHSSGVEGLVTYATDLYGRATAQHLADAFTTVLDALCADTARRFSRLPLAVAKGGPAAPASRAAAPARRPDLRALPDTPDDPVCSVLTRLWSQVLEVPEAEIGSDDNFFRLGGRSLDLTRLTSAVRDTLHVQVSAARLYQARTVAEQAAAVRDEEPQPGFAEKLARAVLRLWSMSPQERRRLAARRRPDDAAAPVPPPRGED